MVAKYSIGDRVILKGVTPRVTRILGTRTVPESFFPSQYLIETTIKNQYDLGDKRVTDFFNVDLSKASTRNWCHIPESFLQPYLEKIMSDKKDETSDKKDEM